VFFLAPLLAALFFGRTFCAAVCPHGAIQDLMLLRPVKVPDWLDQSLRLLAYVYLGLGVLFAVLGAGFIICQFDPFVPIFRRTGSWPMVLAGAAFLVIGIFVGRPYCRYLCPYGVLLGLASCVSKWRVRITPADCVQCRLCEESCPVGAIHKSSLPQPPAQRAADKRRVAAALALLPLIIAATAWVGGHLGATLARKHLTVSLAERVYLEESGRVEGTTDYSAKFRDTGRAVAALYDEARGVESRFSTGGAWFGVWVGLVIGLKLVSFSMGRRRTDYEADQVACVACARCYNFCPEEHVRLVQVGAMPLPAAQPASQKG
jgi:polyferredoxin